MISAVPSVSSVHVELDDRLSSTAGRTDVTTKHVEWLKMVWVEFGCPGHGKGPWDGLGAMAKSKVTIDIMHGKEHTSTGKITSSMQVAQHLRSIFCTKGWSMEHTDMKINEVVVMYLNDDQVRRPVVPPIVSPCKGIMSCFSFFFLVYRGTMRDGRTAVGARHALVGEVEDMDRSPAEQIS